MGIGYEVSCNECSYSRSINIGVGMLHSSLEAAIDSTSKKEQEKIKKIIFGKQNLENDSEGYTIFQCDNCSAIVNKFHIKIMEKNEILFENHPKCFKCKKEMRLIHCDQDKDTIEDIKCPKCQGNNTHVVHNMLWD